MHAAMHCAPLVLAVAALALFHLSWCVVSLVWCVGMLLSGQCCCRVLPHMCAAKTLLPLPRVANSSTGSAGACISLSCRAGRLGSTDAVHVGCYDLQHLDVGSLHASVARWLRCGSVWCCRAMTSRTPAKPRMQHVHAFCNHHFVLLHGRRYRGFMFLSCTGTSGTLHSRCKPGCQAW